MESCLESLKEGIGGRSTYVDRENHVITSIDERLHTELWPGAYVLAENDSSWLGSIFDSQPSTTNPVHGRTTMDQALVFGAAAPVALLSDVELPSYRLEQKGQARARQTKELVTRPVTFQESELLQNGSPAVVSNTARVPRVQHEDEPIVALVGPCGTRNQQLPSAAASNGKVTLAGRLHKQRNVQDVAARLPQQQSFNPTAPPYNVTAPFLPSAL